MKFGYKVSTSCFGLLSTYYNCFSKHYHRQIGTEMRLGYRVSKSRLFFIFLHAVYKYAQHVTRKEYENFDTIKEIQ